jgi:hypothetical protein|nr:MAG TPA: hypothetical protein [Herelleviridae sp.]
MFDKLGIDFNEFDLYNENTKNKLNQKMLSMGYALKSEIPTRDDIILQYYKIDSTKDNKLLEYLITLTYYTRDTIDYILESVNFSLTTKESEVIEISNREEWLKKLPKNENLDNLYEQGRFGGNLDD